jgi:TonB family protein
MMLRPNMFLATFIVLPIRLIAGPASSFQDAKAVSEYSQTVTVKQRPASLVLELDRAIRVLKRGLKDNWETRDQYLIAIEKTPSTDSAGRPVGDAKKYLECAIGANLRSRQIWDESPPLGVEVNRTIVEFTKLRNEAEQAMAAEGESSNRGLQVAEFRLPPCIVSPRPNLAVSSGVAAGMLKTKVDPIYPADVNVSGTVVLHATISTQGRVETLRVISGPAMLQQAALDAVRQWTYQPYRLNNKTVEVETTINVVFTPRN